MADDDREPGLFERVKDAVTGRGDRYRDEDRDRDRYRDDDDD